MKEEKCKKVVRCYVQEVYDYGVEDWAGQAWCNDYDVKKAILEEEEDVCVEWHYISRPQRL